MPLISLYRGVTAYLGEIWEYRYFWASLVKAELQRRYRRSLLGLGWSMLQPICLTVVLALVYSKLFRMNFVEFAPLLLSGLSFWNFVSGNVLQGCTSILTAESYIRQQSLPLAIFPLRNVLVIGFHFLVSQALVLAFVWCSRGPQSVLALASLIPTLALLFLFGWAVGLLIGFFHVYFPDTQHLAEVALQALMFLTPIMYPPSLLESNGLSFLLTLNPLSVFLGLLRDPILSGTFPPLMAYFNPLVTVTVLVGAAVWVVARLERRLIFAL